MAQFSVWRVKTDCCKITWVTWHLFTMTLISSDNLKTATTSGVCQKLLLGLLDLFGWRICTCLSFAAGWQKAICFLLSWSGSDPFLLPYGVVKKKKRNSQMQTRTQYIVTSVHMQHCIFRHITFWTDWSSGGKKSSAKAENHLLPVSLLAPSFPVDFSAAEAWNCSMFRPGPTWPKPLYTPLCLQLYPDLR